MLRGLTCHQKGGGGRTTDFRSPAAEHPHPGQGAAAPPGRGRVRIRAARRSSGDRGHHGSGSFSLGCPGAAPGWAELPPQDLLVQQRRERRKRVFQVQLLREHSSCNSNGQLLLGPGFGANGAVWKVVTWISTGQGQPARAEGRGQRAGDGHVGALMLKRPRQEAEGRGLWRWE